MGSQCSPLLSSSFGSSLGSFCPRDLFRNHGENESFSVDPSLLLLVHQFLIVLQFGSGKTVRIFDILVDEGLLADKAIVIAVELFEERAAASSGNIYSIANSRKARSTMMLGSTRGSTSIRGLRVVLLPNLTI
jgi:hypothetical protein